MRYIRVNARPNRKARRTMAAIARRTGDTAELERATTMGVTQPYERTTPRIGRNEPCPCKSNRKFKVCHGRAAA